MVDEGAVCVLVSTTPTTPPKITQMCVVQTLLDPLVQVAWVTGITTRYTNHPPC